VDPLCHTLVGAALAQSGLKRWASRATTTLLVAANLPDVDILAIGLGRSLEIRRGVTHGVLALAVWPLLLAGLVWGWNRWRPVAGGNRYRDLVALSAIGVLTHPFLDFLNNYGMRWLMPFVDRWYYGDTLFIVDPFMYLFLTAAVVVSWWRGRRHREIGERWARVGLALAMVYVGAMMATTLAARRGVERTVASTPLAGKRFMATAVFGDPFTKEVILDGGDRYHLGQFRLGRGAGLEWTMTVPTGIPGPRPLAPSRELSAFLHWARFPVVEPLGGDRFGVYDLRYARGGRSWAAVEFTGMGPDSAPPPGSSTAPPLEPPGPATPN